MLPAGPVVAAEDREHSIWLADRRSSFTAGLEEEYAADAPRAV